MSAAFRCHERARKKRAARKRFSEAVRSCGAYAQKHLPPDEIAAAARSLSGLRFPEESRPSNRSRRASRNRGDDSEKQRCAPVLREFVPHSHREYHAPACKARSTSAARFQNRSSSQTESRA